MSEGQWRGPDNGDDTTLYTEGGQGAGGLPPSPMGTWTEEEREKFRRGEYADKPKRQVIIDMNAGTAYPSWEEYQAAREAERRGFGYYLAIFLIIVGAGACIVGCMFLGYLIFGPLWGLL